MPESGDGFRRKSSVCVDRPSMVGGDFDSRVHPFGNVVAAEATAMFHDTLAGTCRLLTA